jgi:hypothetical protein
VERNAFRGAVAGARRAESTSVTKLAKNRPEIHGSVRAEKSVRGSRRFSGAFYLPIADRSAATETRRATGRRSVSDHGWSAHASRWPRGRRTRQARLAGACVARCPRRARRVRENANCAPQQGRPRWPRPRRDPHERRRAPG